MPTITQDRQTINKMEILIIHQHYFPEMSGTARRTKELAECFIKMGHNVNVITSYPRQFRSLPSGEASKYEIINNVKVNRIKTLFIIKKNVLFRMISYSEFVLKSLITALRISRKSDIVISIAPLSSGIIGALVNIISKKHHHFDVPDILPDLGISAGMISNKFLIKLLRRIESWVYVHADSISTCTFGQLNNINQKGIPLKKLTCIPDWIDDSFFKLNLDKYYNHVSKLYGCPDKKIISFVGNIGALQNPTIFAEVMELFKLKDLHEYVFFFIGDGIMLTDIEEMVRIKKLDNIKFIGRVKREYIPALMKISDVLVTNYVSDDHLALYIPGKLFEYAISKTPIVIGAKGDAKEFIEKYNLGLVVPPSNKNAFMDAIIKISNGSYKYNPDTAQFTVDYSIENIVKKYNKIFNKYINIQA